MATSMDIFATIFFFDDNQGEIERGDTIELDGWFWLVPQWIDNTALKLTKPARLVRICPAAPRTKDHPYTLPYAVPRAVFEGRSQPEQGSVFVVLENPVGPVFELPTRH
jgi:hypothetical protein